MKSGPFPIRDPILGAAFAPLADALSHSAFVPVKTATLGNAVDAPAPKLGFWERIDRWAWDQVQKDREAYLSKAQNHADLEERIRRLDSYRSRFY